MIAMISFASSEESDHYLHLKCSKIFTFFIVSKIMGKNGHEQMQTNFTGWVKNRVTQFDFHTAPFLPPF